VLNYILWSSAGVLYYPVFFQLYRTRWEAIDYTHAYFILPVSLWLIYRKRLALKEIILKEQYRDEVPGMLLILLGLFMFIFAWRRDFLVLSTFSLIPFIFGLLLFLHGRRLVKALFFPVFYLLFLIPPPVGILDSITIPMRFWITIATESVLKLAHYPIIRDGLLLSIGGKEIFMGVPCSGFRSLITMLSLGFIYVYLGKGSYMKKTFLILSIFPMAILGNFLRISSLCIVTYHFGEKAGHVYHDASGFIIFLLLISGLIWADGFFNKYIKS